MVGSEVLCVGEVLWDSLPSGLFLGGAPFNVACHLHALGVSAGIVSRVGADRLGTEALQRIEAQGIATGLIQRDPALETGFVSVTMTPGGIPSYGVIAPAAWDRIELEEGLLERTARASAMVFGSLAQRDAVSRLTIEQLCAVDTFKVFDVNLRPPHDDSGIVRTSLAHADLIKLNDAELQQMAEWFGLPSELRDATTALAELFECGTICVTRGGNGAALLREGRWSEHSGFRVNARDTVGAGDAFLAAILSGMLSGNDDDNLLRHANLLGAYVATQSGATPVYRNDALAQILSSNGQPADGRCFGHW